MNPSIGVLKKTENDACIPDGNNMEKMGYHGQGFAFEKSALNDFFGTLIDDEDKENESKIQSPSRRGDCFAGDV